MDDFKTDEREMPNMAETIERWAVRLSDDNHVVAKTDSTMIVRNLSTGTTFFAFFD